MFSQYKIFGLTGLLCVGLAAPFHANAVEVTKTMFLDPSAACQLSIPTIDTAVRPRATGFRNEGTQNAFVVCGLNIHFSSTLGGTVFMSFNSFDGVAHAMNCTGVNRQSSGSSAVYVVKAVAIPSSGGVVQTWTDTDFPSPGFDYSVTCILPPGGAITGVRMDYKDNVGL